MGIIRSYQYDIKISQHCLLLENYIKLSECVYWTCQCPSTLLKSCVIMGDNTVGLTVSTIEAMKEMAADPLKSAAIVQDDTCLGGLVIVLSNTDWHIVKTALETIQRLAERQEHRAHMRGFIGMMDQLHTLSLRACPVVKELAKRVYDQLMQCSHQNYHHQYNHASHHNNHQHNHSQGPLKDTGNQNMTAAKDAPSKKPSRRNSFFIGGVGKCKTITLQVKGMDHKDDIELCRNSLLTVSGVVSITFDSRLRRAILRCKPTLKPELLAQAIAKTMTMYAEQVVKDEDGNEVLMSFGKNAMGLNKENENLPEYPSDSDSPIKGHENMARMGAPPPSTEGGSWGLFKSMSSFLSNSFYW